MVFFFGLIFAALALGQIVALAYGQTLASKGHSDVSKAHREAAVNATIIVMMGGLIMAPFPWYKQAPISKAYFAIANNLKPRDKKGNGWLAPQTYGDKKEAKAAQQMYSLIHRSILAAILSIFGGLAGGALAKTFEGQIKTGGSQRYVPPSGPRSPFTGRPY